MTKLSLKIEQRNALGIATLMARRGVPASALTQALKLAPPQGPRWTSDGDLTLLGVGPQTWLALRLAAEPDFALWLRDALAGLASVFDQSSGYVVYRLSGSGARLALQRGAAIDLDPAAFACGSVATTVIAHIGVTLWQVDAEPTYDVALFRSFQASFRHWLTQVAETFPYIKTRSPWLIRPTF